MDNKYLVAKSYQSLPQVGEEYTVNGRTYVKVRTKTGDLKQVRTYTQKEYNKYNPPVKVIQPAKSRRDTLGFGEKGFIWLFKGKTPDATYSNLDWFRDSPCRYTRVWGWYLPSDIEMPDPIPVDVEPVKLEWADVSLDDQLIPDDQIVKVVEGLLYDAGTSEYVGKVGDRVEFDCTCTRASITQGAYGLSYFYVFTSDDGNVYTWGTSAKSLDEGVRYHVKGTVKDHNTFRNNKQTVLKNCRVEDIE